MVTKKPVPHGYKQTEVGVIPQDWQVDNLERFWVVTDCKHITAEFVSNGIPVASIREVQSYFVELKNAKQTTELYYLELIEGGRKPQPGDLIFSRNATVGEVAQVCEWHPPFAMDQDVCLLRKKDPNFSSDYLQAVIRSPIVIEQLANLMVGSTFKRVNVEQIRNLTVPMPLPEEQRVIAQSLSDVDALITECDRLITKKRHIKQGTMQQLLTGKKRLPGFSGEWEVKKLGGECELITKGTTPTSLGKRFKNNGINFIKAESLEENGDVIIDKIAFIDYETHSLLKRSQLQENDILVSIARVLGRTAMVKKELLPANTNQALAIARLRESGKITHIYIFYYLKSSLIRKQIDFINVQAAQANLSWENINDLIIYFPSLPEPKAIAQILSDMDAEIAALEQKRDKYNNIKHAMMQELLTGKIRLKNNSAD